MKTKINVQSLWRVQLLFCFVCSVLFCQRSWLRPMSKRDGLATNNLAFLAVCWLPCASSDSTLRSRNHRDPHNKHSSPLRVWGICGWCQRGNVLCWTASSCSPTLQKLVNELLDFSEKAGPQLRNSSALDLNRASGTITVTEFCCSTEAKMFPPFVLCVYSDSTHFGISRLDTTQLNWNENSQTRNCV